MKRIMKNIALAIGLYCAFFVFVCMGAFSLMWLVDNLHTICLFVGMFIPMNLSDTIRGLFGLGIICSAVLTIIYYIAHFIGRRN